MKAIVSLWTQRLFRLWSLSARHWAWALALLVLALSAVSGCTHLGGGGGEGLLADRTPTKAQGVGNVERLNDGLVPHVGGPWNSNRTAVFDGAKAYVEWDLGQETKIAAVAVLADNNDTYELKGSVDGKKFRNLWRAPRVREPGLRWRSTDKVEGSARYLRLTPGAGDRSLSAAELAVYTEKPAELPPQLREVSSLPADLAYRSALLVFATALIAAVVFAYSGAPILYLLALIGLVAAAAFPLVTAFIDVWPIEKLEVSLTRAVVATIAAAVALREGFGPRKYPAAGWLCVAALSLTALVGVAAFYNLGRPQFHDHKENHPSVVHNYDMRVYFPVAKYFEELKYDGLYLASVATYAEEHGGLDKPQMQRVELRDLRDHRMRRVSDIQPEVEAVKSRFSPERWEELKVDMAYFWETMGSQGYLGSMRDHGGNATPVWLAIAYLMYGKVQASNEVLLWGGALDPLLLLLLFGVVWRTFGVRTALVCMVVFGANDFYMFGSNWAGATLRHDWMVYLGLGACALKAKRWEVGGALLAMSALIRAFPAITLLALAVPALWWLYEQTREHGQLPRLQEIVQKQMWLLRTAAGATVCVIVMVLFSSFVLGFDAWPLWVKKISSFTSDPHVNHVSLLTVTSGSEGNQAAVRMSRLPFHIAATVVYLALAAWAARTSKPHQVALLGILMMPVLMYPANYYIHFVFLLPMLVDERGRGAIPRLGKHTAMVWTTILGLCAAQYFTVKEKELDVHFYNASVLLMLATMAILVLLIRRGLASPEPAFALAGGGESSAPARASDDDSARQDRSEGELGAPDDEPPAVSEAGESASSDTRAEGESPVGDNAMTNERTSKPPTND